MKRIKKTVRKPGWAILAGCVLMLILFGSYNVVQKNIHSVCEPCISVAEHLPSSNVGPVYVLGGAGPGNMKNLDRAAALYRAGLTDRILLFECTEKWNYDTILWRNITKNEKELRRLARKGIPANRISLVPIKEGFFGTLSEAETITRYLSEKGYTSVILIATSGHTRRVSLSFGHFLHQKNIAMYIARSGYKFGTKEVALEMVKIQVYRLIIALFG